jgi:ATP-binding cassette subfamily B protein
MDQAATTFVWPVERLAEAIEALALISGRAAKAAGASASRLKSRNARSDNIEGGIESLSRLLEFEVEAADVPYASVERTLTSAGPALLKVNGPEGEGVLVLIDAAFGHARLLASDGRRYRMPVATVASWLMGHLEGPLYADVDQLLDDSGVPPSRRPAARRALLGTRLAALPATRCWMLSPLPAATLWQHMCHARLPRRLAVFLVAYCGAAVASLGAWVLIGRAALEGRFDPGTLLAWTFLLLSVVPLGLFALWSQGVFMIGLSGILKMRLLAGAMKLDADETRAHGIGRHLARVLDSSALEGLALSGGFYALTAVFDLLLAVTILVVTSRGTMLVVLLACIAAVCVVGVGYYRSRARWTAARLQLTDTLVEHMVGHRTRMVQAPVAARHDAEDEALSQYLELSRRMDRSGMVLSLLPRGWLLVGLGALTPQFAGGSTPGVLAVGVGATLLASGALVKLSGSLTTLVDAAISWKQVAPLLDALKQPEAIGHVEAAAEPIRRPHHPRTGPLVAGQDLAFQFGGRAHSVLQGCNFRIAPGDRIHLTGPSGSGKSTLVSLLTGLRMPDSGLLLLQGLDRATLGPKAWRRRIAAAPQFHENHLFSETLAFNLLMARRWPPTADDLRWAEIVCRRLDLGELIDRMPAGLFQLVGETGWQLSHGERSRIFMARALLQGAELVVLDESFAELDPDSLRRCLPEAAELSKTLLVVAHA